jgi:hypothetical protein
VVTAIVLLVAAAPVLILSLGRAEVQPVPVPVSRFDPELGVPLGEPLYSAATGAALEMDGIVEPAWDQAPILSAPLHYGLHGKDPAGFVELRSLHDAERVYFLARWPAGSPSNEEPGDVPPELLLRNLMTVHWRLVDPGLVSGESTASEGLACTVGCHTTTADGRGQLVGIRSETIPPGLNDDLPSGGGWSGGEWLLEWSRPKVSDSPYDQDLVDAGQHYRFFVKLFLGLEDRPDPTTDVHELRLGQ